MKEFSLQSKVVPPVTAYPKTISGFLSFLSNYLFFDDKTTIKSYTIDPSRPANITTDSDKIWFQTKVSTDSPIVPRVFNAGTWQPFDVFNQGDIVLVPEGATIQSPWGEPNGVTYNVIRYPGSGSTTTVPYTTPSVSAAPPPSGFKYKVYAGYY